MSPRVSQTEYEVVLFEGPLTVKSAVALVIALLLAGALLGSCKYRRATEDLEPLRTLLHSHLQAREGRESLPAVEESLRQIPPSDEAEQAAQTMLERINVELLGVEVRGGFFYTLGNRFYVQVEYTTEHRKRNGLSSSTERLSIQRQGYFGWDTTEIWTCPRWSWQLAPWR